MIVKGKVMFIEEIPAREKWSAGQRITILETYKDGRPNIVNVFTTNGRGTRKIGDVVEIEVLISSKTGIFIRET